MSRKKYSSLARPITVKFDDGTEWKVGNIYALIARLEAYIQNLPVREWVREMRDAPVDWLAIASEREKKQSRKVKNREVSKHSRGGQKDEILAEWKKRRDTQPDTIPNSAITNAVAKDFKKTRAYVRTIIKGET